MLRVIRAVQNRRSAVCLLAVSLLFSLLGPAKGTAQPQSLSAECQEDARKVGEQWSVANADWEAVQRAESKLSALHATMKGWAARLQASPDQSDQAIRGILAVLSQLKQARADLLSARTRWDRDDVQTNLLQLHLEVCIDKLDKMRGAKPGEGTAVLTLGVLDRTETVNLSLKHGTWNITGRSRQGIKLPSHDPGASDSTSPVKVSRAVNATASVAPALPSGWVLWVGIGADAKTPAGENLCQADRECTATSGPYPGVRRGFGKGWAAAESVEVWLCRVNQPCYGRTDPVANINISWVPSP
jgi:hypothetical protein